MLLLPLPPHKECPWCIIGDVEQVDLSSTSFALALNHFLHCPPIVQSDLLFSPVATWVNLCSFPDDGKEKDNSVSAFALMEDF